MALNTTQQRQVVEFLNKKRKHHACPKCNENTWAVEGVVQMSLQSEVGTFILGGPFLPLATVTCRNCGHTDLVNLVIAGVIQGAATSGGA